MLAALYLPVALSRLAAALQPSLPQTVAHALMLALYIQSVALELVLETAAPTEVRSATRETPLGCRRGICTQPHARPHAASSSAAKALSYARPHKDIYKLSVLHTVRARTAPECCSWPKSSPQKYTIVFPVFFHGRSPRHKNTLLSSLFL
eukprot:2337554-Pleurochrysis_carterae.AAC.3